MLDNTVSSDGILRRSPPSDRIEDERTGDGLEDLNEEFRHGQRNIFHSISSSVEYMLESFYSLMIDSSLFWWEFLFHMITFPFQNQHDSFTRVSTRSGRVSMLYSHPDYEYGYQTKELTILSIVLLMLNLTHYHLGDSDLLVATTAQSMHTNYQPGIEVFPNPFISTTVFLLEMLQDWLRSSILGGGDFNVVQYFNNSTHVDVNSDKRIQELKMFQNVEQATISLILPPIVLGVFLLVTVILFLCGHVFFLCMLWLSQRVSSHNEDDVSTNASGDEPLGLTEDTFLLGPIHTTIPVNSSSETFSSILILFGLIVVFILETVLPLLMLGTGLYLYFFSFCCMEDYDHKSVTALTSIVLQISPITNYVHWTTIIPIFALSATVWWLIICGVQTLRSGIYRSLQDGADNITTEDI